MTSWLKRINNVKTVLESLLNQDVKADYIEINLSLLEFPNKEKDLPQDLVNVINNNKCIEVNWVEDNPGVFKKIIPTLKKFYGKEYWLLSCDDDYIYRHDYIKTIVEGIKNSGLDTFVLSNGVIVGNRQAYRASVFKPDFWEKLTQEVIDTRIDDFYIEHYLRSYKRKIGGYRPRDVMDMIKEYNQCCPNSHNTVTGQYSSGEIMRARKIINKIRFDNNA